MTGDQWYNLLKLALILAFGALVLFGLYKIATSGDSSRRNDD